MAGGCTSVHGWRRCSRPEVPSWSASTPRRAVTWHQLTSDIVATPAPRLGLALGLTALNYVTLATYDLLAFAYVGRIVRRRIARSRATSSPMLNGLVT